MNWAVAIILWRGKMLKLSLERTNGVRVIEQTNSAIAIGVKGRLRQEVYLNYNKKSLKLTMTIGVVGLD